MQAIVSLNMYDILIDIDAWTLFRSNICTIQNELICIENKYQTNKAKCSAITEAENKYQILLCYIDYICAVDLCIQHYYNTINCYILAINNSGKQHSRISKYVNEILESKKKTISNLEFEFQNKRQNLW